MRISSNFLFCILILGSAKYSFAESDPHSSVLEPVTTSVESILDLFNNNTPSEGEKTPETEKSDTSEPKTPPCQQCDDEAASFHTAQSETWTLSLTGASVRVTPGSETDGTVTGGDAFGENLYKFLYIRYTWRHCANKIVFEVVVCFYNTEFESSKQAVSYPHGIAQVHIPIEANGKKNNSNFNEMNNKMKEIKKPGDSTQIHSIDTYSWFDNFPVDAVYEYFDSTYYDEDSGQNYNCSISVYLPSEPEENYISILQFYDAFGSLKDKSGDDLKSNMPPKDTPLSSPKKGTGINVIPT
ncbi:uncharacterized protein LOC135848709 [Planococcus citri]|uniref:uncharacterized protein LOC135848709 n=1 Tax=Planococcus citri TaxID=170843 RepID=UPI0031F8EE3C